MRRKFREPISGLTHLIGAILSAAALVGALYTAAGRAGRWRIVSLVIFGLSLILLYSSNAIYHLSLLHNPKPLYFKGLGA